MKHQSLETQLISSVLITDLFGQFNHSIEFTEGKGEAAAGRRLTLLYGDNGTGKTTILNLLWNTLSASRESQHRSYLANCPFSTLVISLKNGDEITVTKKEGLLGDYVVSVEGSGLQIEQPYMQLPDGTAMAVQDGADQHKRIIDLEYQVQRHMNVRRSRSARQEPLYFFPEEASDEYVKYLQELNANPYFLADDRQIYGDDIGHMRSARKRRLEPQDEGPNDTKSALGRELELAMKRFHNHMQQLAFVGSQTGSRDTNKIYLEILRRVADRDAIESGASRDADDSEGVVSIPQLLDRLNQVARRTQRYSEFELMPTLRSQPFVRLLKDIPENRAAVAEEVIFSYLESQEARLDALEDTEQLIRTFVEQANGFLKTKRLMFDMSHGIQVVAQTSGEKDVLSPFQLSSGERQILLLLTNTTLARQNTRLFLIDEPELSLNVKWQRKLMSALLACTEGSGMQFVVATHSVEVITGNRESLARLSSN